MLLSLAAAAQSLKGNKATSGCGRSVAPLQVHSLWSCQVSSVPLPPPSAVMIIMIKFRAVSHLRVCQLSLRVSCQGSHPMTADSPILFTTLGVSKCRSNIACLWARQLSCFIPSLLQGHIVPLHVPCVHLRAANHKLIWCHHSRGYALRRIARMPSFCVIQPHRQPHHFPQSQLRDQTST